MRKGERKKTTSIIIEKREQAGKMRELRSSYRREKRGAKYL